MRSREGQLAIRYHEGAVEIRVCTHEVPAAECLECPIIALGARGTVQAIAMLRISLAEMERVVAA